MKGKKYKREANMFLRNSFVVIVSLIVLVGCSIDIISKFKPTVTSETAIKVKEEKFYFLSEEKSLEKNPKIELQKVRGLKELSLKDIDDNSSTTERIYAMFNFFIFEGFTPEAAAGIIGNAAIESCYDPTAKNMRGFHGLFQWNTNAKGEYWWYDVCSWINMNGYPCYNFEWQVRAVLYCDNRGFLTDDRLKELRKLENIDKATELFAVYYEGCIGGNDETKYYKIGEKYQLLKQRSEEAHLVYDMYMSDSDKYTGNYAYVKKH